MKKVYYFSILPSKEEKMVKLRIIKPYGLIDTKYKYLDIDISIRNIIIDFTSKNNIIYTLKSNVSYVLEHKRMYKGQWKEYEISLLKFEENLTLIDYYTGDIISSSISCKSIFNIIETQEKYKYCSVIDLNSIDENTLVIDPSVSYENGKEIIKAFIYAYNGNKCTKIYLETPTIIKHNVDEIRQIVTNEIKSKVLNNCDKIDYVIVSNNTYFL